MIGWWWRAGAPVEPSPADGVATTLAELVALRAKVRGPAPITHAAKAGQHRARLLGRGLEFAESRPYQPGDDVRRIDWRHTARRGRPCTKVFHDERERALLLLADVGASMRFGTRRAFKSVAAARAAATLAWAAVDAGERVGALVSDGAELRRVAVLRAPTAPFMLLDALVAATASTTTATVPLAPAIRTLARLAPPGARCVLVSDFRGLDCDAESQLAALAQRRTLAFVQVFDAVEAAAPPPGLYPVADVAGERLLDLRTEAARDAYVLRFAERSARLAAVARRFGAPLVALATDADPTAALRALAAVPRVRPTRAPTARSA